MLSYTQTCGLPGGHGWTCGLQATPSRRRDKLNAWVASMSCQSLRLEHQDHRCPSQTESWHMLSSPAAVAGVQLGTGWEAIRPDQALWAAHTRCN